MTRPGNEAAGIGWLRPGLKRLSTLLLAFLAGAASVLAFSPFGLFPLAFLSLGVLVFLVDREVLARKAFGIGFSWGLGLFIAGVSWLYIALHRYGGVPAPVAGLAILLFCAYLAVFPALVSALFVRWRASLSPPVAALLFAGLWVVAELLRGWLFTGFPWLSAGYSQTPPSPLAGFIPVVGVYGVSGMVVFVSALMALVRWRRLDTARNAFGGVLALIGVVALAGFGLGRVAWTSPAGEPTSVALIQTNIEQDLKWRPELMLEWLKVNADLAGQSSASIVVLPETALPTLAEHLPDGYLGALSERASRGNADLVVGVFSRNEQGQIFNAAVSLGRATEQFYAKRHLVPFGEYSPPLFGWFYRVADIPMSDQSPGPAHQRPMALGGQRIAINICYEDLFGRELLGSLPEATLMLNLSNLAWYGASLAQPQHLQIARVRALETGRPMLRATNTGMTAVVLPDGRVAGALPQFERGILEMDVTGYQGLTPYARWGDRAAMLMALAALIAASLARRAVWRRWQSGD